MAGRMSLLRRRREQRVFGDSLADLLDGWRPVTQAGVPVTAESALRVSAVWACVTLIADIVATLPLAAYRRRDGLPVPVAPTPPLLTDPSVTVDATSWRRQIVLSWLLRGNAYGWVARETDAWPAQIELLHPDRVTVSREGRDGPVRYRVDGRLTDPWPAGPLWHVPGLTLPGSPVGVSVLDHAREHIGLSQAARTFGAQWFADGAHPSAVLKTDQPINEEQARLIKRRFVDAIRGRREPAVLGMGLDYQPIQVAANESQFLDTIRANAEDIVRFFFPSFVLTMAGTSVTYANVEQRSLNLLTYDLDPWLVRLERALTAVLPGGARTGQYVRIDRESLLRTDALTRYRLADLAIRGGWKSRDEIRQREELPPIPDGTGGQYLWPPYTTTTTSSEGG